MALVMAHDVCRYVGAFGDYCGEPNRDDLAHPAGGVINVRIIPHVF